MTSTRRSPGRALLRLFNTVAFVLGSVLIVLGLTMTVPALVSAANSEPATAMWISIAAGITSISGALIRSLVD